jgi:hypothetical protein
MQPPETHRQVALGCVREGEAGTTPAGTAILIDRRTVQAPHDQRAWLRRSEEPSGSCAACVEDQPLRRQARGARLSPAGGPPITCLGLISFSCASARHPPRVASAFG